MKKLKLAVFASGGGTNLQSIIDKSEAGQIDAQVVVVISNNSQAGALKRAQKHGIANFHISQNQFASEEEFCEKLLSILQNYKVDLIVLAGYLKKIPEKIILTYKNRVINIHPALLPSFGGKGMYGHFVHEAVLARGCKVSGVTVHIVNEEYDQGPIIAQRSVEVKEDDTPETLAQRVLKEEHKIYPEVIQLFATGKIKVIDRRVKIV